MRKIKKLLMPVLLAFLGIGLLLQGNMSNTQIVFAAEYSVTDGADLFTYEEETKLEEEAERISREYDTHVMILTSNAYGTSENFARDLIEDAGVAAFPDGYIGYAVDMADRSYWVDAYGSKERSIFTQSQTDDLAESAADDLKDGDYYESAMGFLKAIERRLIVKTTPMGALKKPFVYPVTTVFMFIGSGVFALIAAWLWTAYKAAGHKDKGIAAQAEAYRSDLQLVRNNHLFSHHYQTRIPVPESRSSSGGGGGGSAGHTGSGGHF